MVFNEDRNPYVFFTLFVQKKISLVIQRHLWLFFETAVLHLLCFFLQALGMLNEGIFWLFSKSNCPILNFAYCEITQLLEFRQSLFDFTFWSVEEKQTRLNSRWNIANILWNIYRHRLKKNAGWNGCRTEGYKWVGYDWDGNLWARLC